MDKCASVRHPKESNESKFSKLEIPYNESKCLIIQKAPIEDHVNSSVTDSNFDVYIVIGGTQSTINKSSEDIKDAKLIVLNKMHLREFPDGILQLKSLREIDLSENKMQYIPNELNQLPNLTVFDVSRNILSELPESLFSLQKLQVLIISENKICHLPNSISKLKNLEVLACSFNMIEFFPEEITELTRLIVLTATNNYLCYLPHGFTELRSLQILQLDANKFDHIPYQIFSCIGLMEFTFSKNHVSGPIPEEIGLLRNLRTLNLAHNQITSCTSSISALERLEYLNLNFNKLRIIEFEWEKFTQLREIHLSSCILNELPNSIAKLTNIHLLNLSNNKLKELPEYAPANSALTALFVSKNYINRIPLWVCTLTKLSVIELQSNQLSVLPAKFKYVMQNLRMLDLSSNAFSIVPSCIFTPVNRLTYLSLDSNPLTEVPKEISMCIHLTHLSISNCSQIKTLPIELGYCTNLRAFRASHCSITILPDSFISLHSLKYLDISHNQFESFPVVVCFLPRLKVLLFDQQEGKPLVTDKDPEGWFERSKYLHPKNEDDQYTSGTEISYEFPNSLEEAMQSKDLKSGLPAVIGRMSQLVHLSLQGNGLFTLPDVFHHLNLKRLNLGHNRLHFLPPNFHKASQLTHLYLNNNRLKRLDKNFQELRSLAFLTISENPLAAPLSTFSSGRKVLPVHHYLRQQQLFEASLMREMCTVIVRSLPDERVNIFLEKVGFTESALATLLQEYPGQYNQNKRLIVALEAWTGLTIEVETPSKTFNTIGPAENTEESAESSKSSSLPLSHSGESGTISNELDGTKAVTLPRTMSEHSANVRSSMLYAYPDVTQLSQLSIRGPEASPDRILHIVSLISLPTLYDQLMFIMYSSQIPRF